VVQAFFPGEEGGPAIAGVLSGRVNPSGHLPVSLPRSAGAQPYTYLHPALGGDGDVTNLSTVPTLPFGHGLSYTTFTRTDLRVAPGASTSDGLTVTVTVTNTGERDGADVVQFYGKDVVASVTRPVAQLLGYHRVELAAGQSAEVELTIPAARLAFTDRSGRRVVEPGALEVWVGPSCAQREVEASVDLEGPTYATTIDDPRWTGVTVR
jgi:hypothetical protein